MQFRYFFLTTLFFFSCLCFGFAQQSTVLNHGGTVLTVKFSPVDNTLVASAGDNNTIKLWDLQNDTMVTFSGHTAKINSIAFSPDGNLLASGSADRTVRLWDVHTQQNIATLEHITDKGLSEVQVVAFSRDGQLLATGAYDVILWDIHARKEIATLPHNNFVWSLAFSPNGQFLATGDHAGTVTVWDVAEHKVIIELEGSIHEVRSVVFSPDGKTLAISTWAGAINLWAVPNWTLISALPNWTTAYALDITSDNRTLASTSGTGITLWSLENGRQIGSLQETLDWVHGVSFSPDGKTLAYCGDDGAVRVENIASYLQTHSQDIPIVKLLYILPNDRSPQPDIDAAIERRIKGIQQAFAEQMAQHGFGRKTFTYQTDTSGKAVVHHLKGQFNEAYYQNNSETFWDEFADRIDFSTNVYIAFIDVSSERISREHGPTCGYGGHIGTVGGRILVPASGECVDGDYGFGALVHELGHAFGLQHDFRSDAYFMSYGANRNQFSYAAAEWLDAHRYFNANQTYFNIPPTIEMLKSRMTLSGNILLRFKITDPDGLHQAQLHTPATKVNEIIGFLKMIGYQSLSGETKNVRFVTAELTPANRSISLYVMDTYGNFAAQEFPIDTRTIKLVEDVNGDGTINIQDLVAVAAALGETGENDADVNADGEVNIQDLVAVAAAIGQAAAAPSAIRLQAPAHLTQEDVQNWLTQAQQLDRKNLTTQRGILFLQHLLAVLTPQETILLANYPNPFNPETWIPYQLANPAEVSISIYAIDGKLVRALDLGHQPVGIYESKSRAAYWDGRNAVGESMASGLYFYTFTAGDFTATRKMLILK